MFFKIKNAITQIQSEVNKDDTNQENNNIKDNAIQIKQEEQKELKENKESNNYNQSDCKSCYSSNTKRTRSKRDNNKSKKSEIQRDKVSLVFKDFSDSEIKDLYSKSCFGSKDIIIITKQKELEFSVKSLKEYLTYNLLFPVKPDFIHFDFSNYNDSMNLLYNNKLVSNTNKHVIKVLGNLNILLYKYQQSEFIIQIKQFSDTQHALFITNTTYNMVYKSNLSMNSNVYAFLNWSDYSNCNVNNNNFDKSLLIDYIDDCFLIEFLRRNKAKISFIETTEPFKIVIKLSYEHCNNDNKLINNEECHYIGYIGSEIIYELSLMKIDERKQAKKLYNKLVLNNSNSFSNNYNNSNTKNNKINSLNNSVIINKFNNSSNNSLNNSRGSIDSIKRSILNNDAKPTVSLDPNNVINKDLSNNGNIKSLNQDKAYFNDSTSQKTITSLQKYNNIMMNLVKKINNSDSKTKSCGNNPPTTLTVLENKEVKVNDKIVNNNDNNINNNHNNNDNHITSIANISKISNVNYSNQNNTNNSNFNLSYFNHKSNNITPNKASSDYNNNNNNINNITKNNTNTNAQVNNVAAQFEQNKINQIIKQSDTRSESRTNTQSYSQVTTRINDKSIKSTKTNHPISAVSTYNDKELLNSSYQNSTHYNKSNNYSELTEDNISEYIHKGMSLEQNQKYIKILNSMIPETQIRFMERLWKKNIFVIPTTYKGEDADNGALIKLLNKKDDELKQLMTNSNNTNANNNNTNTNNTNIRAISNEQIDKNKINRLNESFDNKSLKSGGSIKSIVFYGSEKVNKDFSCNQPIDIMSVFSDNRFSYGIGNYCNHHYNYNDNNNNNNLHSSNHQNNFGLNANKFYKNYNQIKEENKSNSKRNTNQSHNTSINNNTVKSKSASNQKLNIKLNTLNTVNTINTINNMSIINNNQVMNRILPIINNTAELINETNDTNNKHSILRKMTCDERIKMLILDDLTADTSFTIDDQKNSTKSEFDNKSLSRNSKLFELILIEKEKRSVYVPKILDAMNKKNNKNEIITSTERIIRGKKRNNTVVPVSNNNSNKNNNNFNDYSNNDEDNNKQFVVINPLYLKGNTSMNNINNTNTNTDLALKEEDHYNNDNNNNNNNNNNNINLNNDLLNNINASHQLIEQVAFSDYLIINPKYNEANNNTNTILEYKKHSLKYLKEATKYQQRNNLIKAMETFDKVLLLNQNEVKAYFEKGNLYYMLNQSLAAITCFEICNILDSAYITPYEHKADIFYEIGNYNKAISVFKNLLKKEKHDYSKELVRFGNKMLGKYLIDYCDKIVDILDSYFNNSINLSSNVNISKRRVNGNSNNISYTNLSDYLSFKGRLLSIKKEEETAIEYFNKAISYNPKDHFNYYLKSVSLSHLNKKEEAIKELDKALLIKKDDVVVLNYKAILLNKLKQREQSVSIFKYITSIDKQTLEYKNNLAYVLIKLNRFSEALDILNNCISIDSEYGLAYCNKSRALYNMNRLEEALICVNKAIDLMEENYSCYKNKGLILSKIGDAATAIECFEIAIEKNPSHYRSYYYLYCIYKSIGEKQSEKEMFDKVKHLKPDFKFPKYCEINVKLRKLRNKN